MKTLNGYRVVCECGDCDGTPHEGKYFLVEVSPQGRDTYYTLSGNVPKTNRSREKCRYGWLGETNGVSRTAHGVLRVDIDGRLHRVPRPVEVAS